MPGKAWHGVDLVDHHLPVVGNENVDSSKALATDRLERLDRQLLHLISELGSYVGRHIKINLLLRQVFGVEVVEARIAVHANLGNHARQWRSALKIIQYTTFEFAGADKSLLDNDLGVVGVCDLDGISSPATSSTLEIPRLDPPRAGLTKSGYCSAATVSKHAVLSRRHSAAVIATKGPIGNPDAANRSFM